MRSAFIAVVALLSCLAAAPAPAADTVVVAVAPFTYTPHPIEVSQGQGVTFANADYFSGAGHTLVHDVPKGSQLFESPIVPVGSSSPVAGVAELTPGTYQFTCRVHRQMSGRLIVKESDSAAPAGDQTV
jgi:plastocyanin